MRINLSSFLQWRLNIYLIQTLGWTFTGIYIYLLGKLYFFLNRNEKRKIQTAISSVFSERIAGWDIKPLTRAVFRGIFSHYYEKIFNAYSPPEDLKTFFRTHIESVGMGALDHALAKGRGVLLITGHLGGVEYIPSYLGAKNYPTTIVVRFSSPYLRTMSLQKAGHYGARIIDADTASNVLRAISNHLKENRIVIIQCDEIDEWRTSRKDKIFFLGKHTFQDKTIAVLSKRASAPIIFGFMHRENNHRYKFIATSLEKMAQGLHRPFDESVGTVVLKFLEKYVYMHPDEWYQWHKYAAIETVTENVLPVPGDSPRDFQPSHRWNPLFG